MDNAKFTGDTENVFSGFSVDQALMVYDFPLLLLCSAPDGSKWMFKWCDYVRKDMNPSTGTPAEYFGDIWLAFRVSNYKLKQFHENHISLRELILMTEDEVVLFNARDIFHPLSTPQFLKPEYLPHGFLPASDIMLDGSSDTFTQEIGSYKGFRIGFHLIFSEMITEGKAPLSIIGPFQDVFQKYLAWSARRMAQESFTEFSSPLGHWTEISPILSSMGSYRIFCSTGELGPPKSLYLVQTCATLKKFLESEKTVIEIRALRDKLGENGFLYFRALLSAISEFNISVNVKWMDENNTEQFIVLSKRIASELLPSISKVIRIDDATVNVRVKLSAEEAEKLRRDIEGQGGMQSLLLKLQRNLTEENVLTLTPDVIERILRYGQHYGQGGFQDRLQGVIRALKRIGISLLGLR